MTSRKGRPAPRFNDATRPEPVRGCICDPSPVIVATFANSQLATVTLEHCAYCPQSTVTLNVNAYMARGEKVPL